MAKAMKGVSKAMSQMNARMNLPQLQKIMMEFEREVSSLIHKQRRRREGGREREGEREGGGGGGGREGERERERERRRERERERERERAKYNNVS